jgi:glycosyltransferase involved in cell wall biosynthesis
MSSFREGIALCTYNRGAKLGEVLEAVLKTKPNAAKLIVCDDGSTDDTPKVVQQFSGLTYIRGDNKGVGANKNRAIYTLQNCDFVCILEDDLLPTQPGWFEMYRSFCLATNIHHFCRVQDKLVDEVVKDFGDWCANYLGFHPIYGPTPRGDLTFISHKVIHRVGAIHPAFVGVGHAHGQWSDRVIADGTLVQHPNKWVDIKEAADKFIQVGDREGGRWNLTTEETKEQVRRNSELRKNLGTAKVYIEPFLP